MVLSIRRQQTLRAQSQKMKLILISFGILLSVEFACIAGQRVKGWGDTSGKSADEKHIFAAPVKGAIQNRNLTYEAVSFCHYETVKVNSIYEMSKPLAESQSCGARPLAVGEKNAS